VFGILLSFHSYAQNFESSLVSMNNVGTAARPIAQAIINVRVVSKGIPHESIIDSTIALGSDGHIESFDEYTNPSVTVQFLTKLNSGTKNNIVSSSIFKIKIIYQSMFKKIVKESMVHVSENGIVKFID